MLGAVAVFILFLIMCMRLLADRVMTVNLNIQIETGDDEEEDEDEDEEQQEIMDWSSGISKIKEMRLVPSDPSQCMFHFLYDVIHPVLPSWLYSNLILLPLCLCFIVETLFEVFCECAELNPEPMLGKQLLNSN